jgi:DNA-binding MarR family transcriptional regulator
MSTASAGARHCAVRLHSATTRLGRQLRSLAPPAELTAAGLSVLGLLARHGALAPSTIAAHEGVRQQTLTRLLADLEGAGLVRREADPGDARRSLLSLTREGARRLSAQVRQREASLEQAIAALPAADRRRLLDACELLEELASRLAASGATVA